MKNNAMFVDHWEALNLQRLEFKAFIQAMLEEAWDTGYGVRHNGGSMEETGKKYAEEKIKDLF